MAKIKKVKKESCHVLEKKLDTIFSKYIRTIHPKKCYTCGNILEYSHLQCGHYISRGHKATRFEENNCRPQCAFCNCYRQGEAWSFRQNLIIEIGEGEVLKLESMAREITKRTPAWYHEKIDYYTKELKSFN
jgi:hypothetical protein